MLQRCGAPTSGFSVGTSIVRFTLKFVCSDVCL